MSQKKYLHDVKPVLIEWTDSMGGAGWCKHATDDQLADMRCVTVGNLMWSRKDRVMVSLNASAYSCGDTIEIPRHAIKRIRRLKA